MSDLLKNVVIKREPSHDKTFQPGQMVLASGPSQMPNNKSILEMSEYNDTFDEEEEILKQRQKIQTAIRENQIVQNYLNQLNSIIENKKRQKDLMSASISQLDSNIMEKESLIDIKKYSYEKLMEQIKILKEQVIQKEKDNQSLRSQQNLKQLNEKRLQEKLMIAIRAYAEQSKAKSLLLSEEQGNKMINFRKKILKEKVRQIFSQQVSFKWSFA